MSEQNDVNSMIKDSDYTLLVKNNRQKSIVFLDRKLRNQYERFSRSDKRDLQKKYAKSKIRSQSMQYGVSYAYAGIFARFIAFFIDVTIAKFAAKLILSYGDAAMLSTFARHNLWIFIYMTYMTLMTFITNGQSLGKMCLGIRVQGQEDKLTFFTVFIREFISKYIMLKLQILFVFAIFSGRKHSPADYFADTDVVKEV